MKKFLPASKGFTLIELMVVVTIIAFLAIIGIVAFTNAQKQARDGRRRADIDAIATAMEANKEPLSGTYPAYTTAIFADGKLPEDPIKGTYNGVSYLYTEPTGGAATYITCARLEKGNGNSSSGTSIVTTGTLDFYCRKSQQ